MSQSIQFSKVYNHPIKKIWDALTDKEALSEWLMPCDFEPIIGHEFKFITKPYPGFDGIVHCKVQQLKEQEVLAFTWNGGSLKNTLVTFTLTIIDETTTRLDFTHSGFEGFVNSVIVRRILARGWKRTLLTRQLQKYLSHE